jgi:isocitrate lyase
LFGIRSGLESAIARAIAYAPYADLIWCETSRPDVNEARQFAEGVMERYPNKMLAYNCSPSFNWKKHLDEASIAQFQRELAAMGYKFQFVTLAGFHALNLAMFELARSYKLSGMTAYSRLQEKEFSREREYGYEAVKHQRFAGTGYFDAVQQVITSGTASTTALQGSTEAEQFTDTNHEPYSGSGPDAGCQPVLGDCPSVVLPTKAASKPTARVHPAPEISAV